MEESSLFGLGDVAEVVELAGEVGVEVDEGLAVGTLSFLFIFGGLGLRFRFFTEVDDDGGAIFRQCANSLFSNFVPTVFFHTFKLLGFAVFLF
jgi:hypothetical protein